MVVESFTPSATTIEGSISNTSLQNLLTTFTYIFVFNYFASSYNLIIISCHKLKIEGGRERERERER